MADELEALLAASRPAGLSLKSFEATEQRGQADAFVKAVRKLIDARLNDAVAPVVADAIKELRRLERRVSELEAKPRVELHRVV